MHIVPAKAGTNSNHMEENTMEYTPKGVCSQQIHFDIVDHKVRNVSFRSQQIHFDIVDHKVRNVSFRGGCNGNLQGISRLIDGMDVDEAIKMSRSARESIKRGGRRITAAILFLPYPLIVYPRYTLYHFFYGRNLAYSL